MDYELLFYMLVSFLAGRLSTLTVYIGQDSKKYENASFGILLKKKVETP